MSDGRAVAVDSPVVRFKGDEGVAGCILPERSVRSIADIGIVVVQHVEQIYDV